MPLSLQNRRFILLCGYSDERRVHRSALVTKITACTRVVLNRTWKANHNYEPRHWVRFFGRTLKRICDLRSYGSLCVKGTDESTLDKDSSVPLVHHDPNDLRSQIRFWILPKKLIQLIVKLSISCTHEVLGGLNICCVRMKAHLKFGQLTHCDPWRLSEDF